ncbi:Chromosome partition protein Smc [Vibrio cholerae]|uniref:hypothetical protein n=1 Tax=Vibrio cholerae TaxID=666 RepID=UPI0011D89E9B|nr:hypothetical protein [Vibrio cholerae]TXZ36790.1 hypothetical protein FXE69_01730 [Vibrio cholerae]GHZ88884.1 Chromosome partition protein Smc [Vibrio cholerae]HDZ9328882.1 hypothetical protein [Vibrio cholerae]
MNTELDTNLKLEDQLNKLIAGGQHVELITAQMLQEVAGNSTLEQCARWLLEYKEAKALSVRVQQPEWVGQFIEKLQGLGEQVWPLIECEIQSQVATQVRDKTQDLEIAQSSLTDANAKLAECAKVINNLEQKLTITELANGQIQNLIQNVESANEKTLNVLEEKNQFFEKRVRELEANLDNSAQQLNDTQKQLIEAQGQVNALTAEIDAAGKKANELEEQVDKLTNLKTELDSDLGSSKNLVKDLKSELAALKKKRSPEEKKLERLQSKVETQKTEIKDLTDRLVQAEGTIEQLANQNARQGEQLERSSERLILASDAYEKALEEAGVLRGKLIVYEAQS